MALRIGTAPSTYHSSFRFFSYSSSSSSSSPYSSSSGFGYICSYSYPSSSLTKKPQSLPLSLSSSFTNHICKAAEYKFPDPIPEFADSVSLFFHFTCINVVLHNHFITVNTYYHLSLIATFLFFIFLYY